MKNIDLINQLINSTGIMSLGQSRTTNSDGAFSAVINYDALKSAKNGDEITPGTQIIEFFSIYGHGIVEVTYSEVSESTRNETNEEWLFPENEKRPFELTLSLFNSLPAIENEDSLIKQLLMADSILYNGECVGYQTNHDLLLISSNEQEQRSHECLLSLSIDDGQDKVSVTLSDILKSTKSKENFHSWDVTSEQGTFSLSPRVTS